MVVTNLSVAVLVFACAKPMVSLRATCFTSREAASVVGAVLGPSASL